MLSGNAFIIAWLLRSPSICTARCGIVSKYVLRPATFPSRCCMAPEEQGWKQRRPQDEIDEPSESGNGDNNRNKRNGGLPTISENGGIAIRHHDAAPLLEDETICYVDASGERERSKDVNILEDDSGADGSGFDEEANNEADVPIHDDAFMSVEMDMMFAMLDCFSEDAVQRVLDCVETYEITPAGMLAASIENALNSPLAPVSRGAA